MSRVGIFTDVQPLSVDVIQSVRALELPYNANRFSNHGPTPILAALMHAATRLRYMPDAPLAEAPVFLTDEQEHDVASNVLKTMINSSIERSEIDPIIPAFNCINPEGRNACLEAEPKFFEALRGHSRLYSDHASADIITQNGTPIMLRKLIGAKTTLTLCDVSIDGIQYPAGSLTHAVIKGDGKAIDKVRSYDVHDVSSVKSLGFIRLSMFALPSGQRDAWPRYATEPIDRLSTASVADINERIQDALHRK